MILVNLLPEEFVEKKITIPVPLREIAVGIFAFFLLVWMVVLMRDGHLKKKCSILQVEQKALTTDLAKADQLIDEMNKILVPKKTFLERFEKPEAQWDQILNLISDSLSEGIWLSSLAISNEEDLVIKIEGLAKPSKDRSTIGSIGDFITQTKRNLDAFVAQGNPKGGSVFRTETFTQQKDLEPVKLTQFTVEFKKK